MQLFRIATWLTIYQNYLGSLKKFPDYSVSGAWEIVFLKAALEIVLQCEAVLKELTNHTHSQKEPLLPILFQPWRMSTKQRLHLKKISQTRQYYSRTEFTREIGTLARPKSSVPREAWPGHQWSGRMCSLSEGWTVTKSVGDNVDHLRINLSVKTKFKPLPSELQFSLSSHL